MAVSPELFAVYWSCGLTPSTAMEEKSPSMLLLFLLFLLLVLSCVLVLCLNLQVFVALFFQNR